MLVYLCQRKNCFAGVEVHQPYFGNWEFYRKGIVVGPLIFKQRHKKGYKFLKLGSPFKQIVVRNHQNEYSNCNGRKTEYIVLVETLKTSICATCWLRTIPDSPDLVENQNFLQHLHDAPAR